MRTAVLILALLVVASAAGAESLRLPPTEQTASGKTLPLKGATSGTAKASSCAAYGRGFYMVEATGTCVKIGGSVSVDTTIRR